MHLAQRNAQTSDTSAVCLPVALPLGHGASRYSSELYPSTLADAVGECVCVCVVWCGACDGDARDESSRGVY